MALPTSITLSTMDYSFQGQPFVEFPAKSIDIATMDYSWHGIPFVRNAFASTTTSINISPTAIAIIAAINAVTHTMSGSVSTAALALTAAVNGIVAGIGPNVTVSNIALTINTGSPTYGLGGAINVTAIDLALSINSPQILPTERILATALALTAALKAPTVELITNINVLVTNQALVSSVLDPRVSIAIDGDTYFIYDSGKIVMWVGGSEVAYFS